MGGSQSEGVTPNRSLLWFGILSIFSKLQIAKFRSHQLVIEEKTKTSKTPWTSTQTTTFSAGRCSCPTELSNTLNPQKQIWSPKHEGLKDDLPLQTGYFQGSSRLSSGEYLQSKHPCQWVKDATHPASYRTGWLIVIRDISIVVD